MIDERSLSAYDYRLPRELIAQRPVEPRDAARLMVVDRRTGTFEHDVFRSLPARLRSGDLIILNNTRVRPAKLIGKVESGARVEALLIRLLSSGLWEALVRCRRPLREDERVGFEHDRIIGRCRGRAERGRYLLELKADGDLEELLDRYGRMPLPPYIHRDAEDALAERDRQWYQTVFAERLGAVAAPTAGLHFTPSLIEALERVGVGVAWVTLHVGSGTFMPVKAERIDEHRMEAEEFDVPLETVARFNEARRCGHRVVVVGTTCCRALEAAALASPEGRLQPHRGKTDLFLRPPFAFRCTDVLITNFHLPKSTLLMLVSAFAGREFILRAYEEAVRMKYRFYSYGDAMLIL